jgi:hypothetical protein
MKMMVTSPVQKQREKKTNEQLASQGANYRVDPDSGSIYYINNGTGNAQNTQPQNQNQNSNPLWRKN